MSNLLPFVLNPTPRQYDLILKFQEEVPTHELEESDFIYPRMTKKMSAVLKILFAGTDFSRTETFVQKHFLGLNFAALNVICKIRKIVGPE